MEMSEEMLHIIRYRGRDLMALTGRNFRTECKRLDHHDRLYLCKMCMPEVINPYFVSHSSPTESERQQNENKKIRKKPQEKIQQKANMI